MPKKSSLETLIERCWLPGRENLARHVPSLSTFSGKLGWLLVFYLGPPAILCLAYLMESIRPDLYLWIQGVLVIGAFVLVDVIGIWDGGCCRNGWGKKHTPFLFPRCSRRD